MSRSRMRLDAPYAMRQSRSISPSRSPPSRERPSVGCPAPHTPHTHHRACCVRRVLLLNETSSF
jgi:hypothetical protein